MNVRNVKKSAPRIDINYLSSLDIQSYGIDNLYPQKIKDISESSETASTCLDRLKGFIEGAGFLDVVFGNMILNKGGDNANDILHNIACDIADYEGFALHINYNILGRVVEINHVPFENCRLGNDDDSGYISKIAVHPDWTGKKKRNGKTLKVSKETIDFIDFFNPNAVFDQIKSCGGIENYKGQIFWFSMAGRMVYPIPRHDRVVSQMSTEEGLGNVTNRNVRNNFFPAGMFITRKGQDVQEEDNNDYSEIEETIARTQGDTNTNKILHIEVEQEEEIPQFVEFPIKNFDKDFTATIEYCEKKIYAAFEQEAFYRIANGSMGFSSEINADAWEYYSSITSKYRVAIQRSLEKIMSIWKDDINVKCEIKPMLYVSRNTNLTV